LRRYDMHKNAKRSILLIAAVALTLGVAGCGTLFFGATLGPNREAPKHVPNRPDRDGPKHAPDRDRPLFQKGQVVDIRGRIVVNNHQIMLEDQNSPAVFRLVGLRPEERKALSRRAGEFTWVRLKVISMESARVYNARFLKSRRSGKSDR
jgi:hypothetical protein